MDFETSNNGREVSSTELFAELKAVAESQGYKWFLKNPIALGVQLGNLEGALGVHFDISRERTGKRRHWSFKLKEEVKAEKQDQSSDAANGSEKGGFPVPTIYGELENRQNQKRLVSEYGATAGHQAAEEGGFREPEKVAVEQAEPEKLGKPLEPESGTDDEVRV